MQPQQDENQQIDQDSAQNIALQNQDTQKRTDTSLNPVATSIQPITTHGSTIMDILINLEPVAIIGALFLLGSHKHGAQHAGAKIFAVSIIVFCIISVLYVGFVRKRMYISSGRWGSYTPTGISAEIIAVIISLAELALIFIIIK